AGPNRGPGIALGHRDSRVLRRPGGPVVDRPEDAAVVAGPDGAPGEGHSVLVDVEAGVRHVGPARASVSRAEQTDAAEPDASVRRDLDHEVVPALAEPRRIRGEVRPGASAVVRLVDSQPAKGGV